MDGWPEEWVTNEFEVSATAKQLATFPLKPRHPETLFDVENTNFDLTQRIELLMRAVLDIKSGIIRMKKELDLVNSQFDKLYAKTLRTSFQFEQMKSEVDKLKQEVYKLQNLGKTTTESNVSLFSTQK